MANFKDASYLLSKFLLDVCHTCKIRLVHFGGVQREQYQATPLSELAPKLHCLLAVTRTAPCLDSCLALCVKIPTQNAHFL